MKRYPLISTKYFFKRSSPNKLVCVASTSTNVGTPKNGRTNGARKVANNTDKTIT